MTSMLTAPLYLLRHGETAWNLERRLQGMQDSALTERGRAQAAGIGRALKAELAGACGPTVFLRSLLGRTRETSLIVGRELGLDPAAWRDDPRLAGVGFGRWEGSTWQEIEAVRPDAHTQWRADPAGFTTPGGRDVLQPAAEVRGRAGRDRSPGDANRRGRPWRERRRLARAAPRPRRPLHDRAGNATESLL